MGGRITLGLYNSYDPRRLHEIHRRSIARAAPVCYAFDTNLALFGFPLEGSFSDIVESLAEDTTIGEGGRYIRLLAREGRLGIFDFPRRGFPPQLGEAVASTSRPEAEKLLTPKELAGRVRRGTSFLVLMGLGRRGLPREVLRSARYHLELSGKGIPFETCTVIGMLPALLHAYRGE
ncbi:MAG: DUF531 domain-containing protein [Euryarchaeota archaeon]|nr:DUF531 domain-containing protein [Euryarchaeota archaeon]